MEAEVYTVPSEVVFKRYTSSTGPQTRNLLIKNTSSQALRAVISYPFSPSFRLSIPADLPVELKSHPPHILLELPPKSTTKVRSHIIAEMVGDVLHAPPTRHLTLTLLVPPRCKQYASSAQPSPNQTLQIPPLDLILPRANLGLFPEPLTAFRTRPPAPPPAPPHSGRAGHRRASTGPRLCHRDLCPLARGAATATAPG